MEKEEIVIIGGGITGLALAWYLEQAGKTGITIYESSSQVGGKINTIKKDGYIVETGPDAFVTIKPDLMALLKDLNLSGELIQPLNNRFFIKRKEVLYPVPPGLASLVPDRILPFITTGLLSPGGKVRMAMEPFIPAKRDEEDESLADFIIRRFGKEMLENFAEPLFTGVYAARAKDLSIKATFPHFRMMEKKSGSITRAVLAQRKKRPSEGGSIFRSFRGGMKTLPETLVRALKHTRIVTGATVEAIEKSGSSYTVNFPGDTSINADKVILTIASPRAGNLLSSGLSKQEQKNFENIKFSSSAIVTLGLGRDQISHPLDGTGFLIPKKYQRKLSACTWLSSKWEARAPEGKALIRCFFSNLDPDELRTAPEVEFINDALEELGQIIGLKGNPEAVWVKKWVNAQPQYRVGHQDRIGKMEASLEKNFPGIFLAGSGYRGIGIPDCVKQAKEIAQKITG